MALADGPKLLGLPRPVVFAGGAALLAGVGYVLWKRHRSSSSSGSSSALDGAAATDTGTTGSDVLNPAAGNGTAGGMTDNFYITLAEQQGSKGKHGADHDHPHPKRDHDHSPAPARRDRDQPAPKREPIGVGPVVTRRRPPRRRVPPPPVTRHR